MTLCVRTRTSHSRCSFEPMEAPKEWSGPAPLHWLQPGQPCGPRPLAAFPRLPAGAGSPIKHFKPCSAHRATRPAAPALTSPLSGTGRAVEQGCAPGVGPWSGTPTARPLRWPAPQCTLPGAPSLPRRPKPRAPLQVVLLKTGEVAGATYDATTAVVRATSRQVALRPDPPPACRPASALLWGAPPPYTPNPALFSQRFRRAGRAHRRRHAVRDGRRGENGRVGSAPLPPRKNRTRRVPHPVLIGHAASLTPY